MSARKRGVDAGALGYKIETAEACGGVVTLRVEEARLLKDAVLQRGALADALEKLVRVVGKCTCQPGALERDEAVRALRAAGRLP